MEQTRWHLLLILPILSILFGLSPFPTSRSPTPAPRPLTPLMSPRVLLIQQEWPARALLKAELEEAGWDVLGADTLRLGIDLSTARGFRPDAVVVDAVGLSTDAADFQELQFLRGRAPLLLLQSGQYNLSDTPISPSAVLRRPFTIGDVVNALRSLTTHD